MSDNTNVIAGAIKVLNYPDSACFTSFSELINSLGKYLVLEIPTGQLTNVVIQPEEPGDDQRDFVWFKQNGTGSVIGIFVWGAGDWQQICPAPNQIIRMYGDSTNIPAGYALADATNPHLTAPEAAALELQWFPVGGPTYTIFDVTFEGY